MNIKYKNFNSYFRQNPKGYTPDKVKLNKYREEKREINENIGPARAISFGGSAVSLAEKFVTLKPINSVVGFVSKNEAGYNAIYSLLIAGMLKPILVLNSKGSEEKDKQLIATKNFLSAFIGSFLTFTVGGTLIKKSVDVIKNNLKLIEPDTEANKLKVVDSNSEAALNLAEDILIEKNSTFKNRYNQTAKANKQNGVIRNFIKALTTDSNYEPPKELVEAKAKELVKTAEAHLPIFSKNKEFVEEMIKGAENAKSGTSYKDGYEIFWKNSTGWITAIGKAKIASILLPIVLTAIFTKKAIEKHSTLLNSNTYNKEKENFKPFNKPDDKNITFKGKGAEAFIDNFAKGVEKLSLTKPGVWCAKTLAKFKKPSPRMGDVESFLLTGYWLQNTARSKKIAPDQKLGFNIQTLLVTLVSWITAIAIDEALDKPIDIAKKAYGNVLQKNIDNIKSNLDPNVTQEELKEIIKNECSHLLGNMDIARKLSKPIPNNSNTVRDVVKDAVQDVSENCGKTLTIFNKDAVEKAVKELSKGYGKKLSKFKSLTIFTFVVRLLVPVMMVPVAGKIKNHYKDFLKNKKDKQVKSDKTVSK